MTFRIHLYDAHSMHAFDILVFLFYYGLLLTEYTASGWEGKFCEADVDGCANFDCFMSVDCVDVPAPGVGAVCGPCPRGYRGDGSKCAGKLYPFYHTPGNLYM